MQIVRTIIWVLLLAGLVLFSFANWEPISVRIWENLLIDTKLPAVVIVSFLIGIIPMWLFHRASKWQMTRRIASLENAARTAQMTPVAPKQVEEVETPPVAEPESELSADSASSSDADTDQPNTPPS